MDTEAWEKLTPFLINGYQSTSCHAKMSPNWWILEIVDGFGAHLASDKALQTRQNGKIRCVKEEGDSSHINQAYDKFVAKSDKLHQLEAANALKNASFITKGVLDQWGLVHAALFAIRACKEETRIKSFCKVNLQPSTRTDFETFIKLIRESLEGGANFDHKMEEDKFDLLPDWWQAMDRMKKQAAMSIVSTHGGFTVDCLSELQVRCNIDFNMASDFCVCYECAIQDPSHLQRDLQTVVVQQGQEKNDDEDYFDVDGFQGNVEQGALNGLTAFQLKPEGLKGIELFEHMVRYRELKCHPKENHMRHTTEASGYLDAHVTYENKCILHMIGNKICGDQVDAKRTILADAFGTNAKVKLARRKLNALGDFKNRCLTLNSDESLKKQENMAMLAASLAQIESLKLKEKEKYIEDLKCQLRACSDAALKKHVQNKGELSKLKKVEIAALIFRFYNKLVDPKKIKKRTDRNFVSSNATKWREIVFCNRSIFWSCSQSICGHITCS